MSRTDPAPFPAVLIVEDEPTIGHHLHLGLQGHGYPHRLVPHRRSRPHPRHRSQTQHRFSRPRPSRPRRCRACALRHYCGTHLLRSPPWCGDCRVVVDLGRSRRVATARGRRFAIDYLRSGSGIVVQLRIWLQCAQRFRGAGVAGARPSWSGRAQEPVRVDRGS